MSIKSIAQGIHKKRVVREQRAKIAAEVATQPARANVALTTAELGRVIEALDRLALDYHTQAEDPAQPNVREHCRRVSSEVTALHGRLETLLSDLTEEGQP